MNLLASHHGFKAMVPVSLGLNLPQPYTFVPTIELEGKELITGGCHVCKVVEGKRFDCAISRWPPMYGESRARSPHVVEYVSFGQKLAELI
jgi:hypothetical protein